MTGRGCWFGCGQSQSSHMSGQVRSNAKINQMHRADWEGKENQFCFASSSSSLPGSVQRGLFGGRARSVHLGWRRRTPPCYTSKTLHTHTEEQGLSEKPPRTNTLCSGRFWLERRARREDAASRRPCPLHLILWAGTWDTEGTGGGHSAAAARKLRCGRGCDGGTAPANDLLLIDSSGLSGHLLEMACGGTSLSFSKASSSWRSLEPKMRRCRCADAPSAELCERFTLSWWREASRRLQTVAM